MYIYIYAMCNMCNAYVMEVVTVGVSCSATATPIASASCIRNPCIFAMCSVCIAYVMEVVTVRCIVYPPCKTPARPR